MNDRRQPVDSEGEPGPRYCLGCGRGAASDLLVQACPSCGDRLASGGYCSVCEDFWRLPADSLCPKHEIPLTATAPPSIRPDLGPGPIRWVTVGSYPDSLAAEPPRIRLDAEGIPTFLEGARMGSRSMYQVATGGVRLKVPERLAAEARVILGQTWRVMAAELDPEADLLADDDWDEVDSASAAPEFWCVGGGGFSPSLGVVALVLVLMPLIVLGGLWWMRWHGP